MAEGIHTLFLDLQSIINGEEQYQSRAARTALTLGLNDIEIKIAEGDYGDAREAVIREWADGNYPQEMDDYVPGTLADRVLNAQ